MTSSHGPFPPHFFRRADESNDALFYREPRFVNHIDRATINALTDFYREAIPAGARVLDLMSSWVSHLPADVEYERVAGLGMNEAELADNPRLDDHAVHNLNRTPELPYGNGEFDAVVNAVSIQYLTRPLDVFASVQRVLRPGGLHAVAISHRMFPQKAVAVWPALSPADRVALVGSYFALTPGWGEPIVVDRSPPDADPLWIVVARTVEVSDAPDDEAGE